MPKIAAETLPAHRDLVRRRIFDAFAQLMDERSFDAITMAQIAARAEIGRTAIYHHFKDKEAVVVAFATEETQHYLADLRRDLDLVPDPVAKIRVYLRHQLRAGQQFHTGMGGILYHLLSEEAMEKIHDHVAAVEEVLEHILDEGIDSGAFRVSDRKAAMSLLHAALATRQLPVPAVEEFVLRGLGHMS
ncbi:TetR/AcrR family transcriptional regulator [Nocardioides sp. LML1-1-1.1]|uniref:TetR/AcrR family transcriptional regulator n=1 Tax=Nocardioides sp. LML1-1-1.1 TaxID=3135248 RepID=UPI003444B3CB